MPVMWRHDAEQLRGACDVGMSHAISELLRHECWPHANVRPGIRPAQHMQRSFNAVAQMLTRADMSRPRAAWLPS